MSKNPLGEVFGFLPGDMSDEARRHRKEKLCPFQDGVTRCTKDKKNNPLGVCSVQDAGGLAITCPFRFRQDGLMIQDAANELLPGNSRWAALREVPVRDGSGRSAGNADYVLVAHDSANKVIDFGALEVQSVYISGNIRHPFEYYMEDAERRYNMTWTPRPNEGGFPGPDYLSSSRKRLLPQLIYKGRIFRAWGKRTVVAIQEAFYNTLPAMPECRREEAEIVWQVYDIRWDRPSNRTKLFRVKQVFTRLEESISTIMTPAVGKVDSFLTVLQQRLDRALDTSILKPKS